MAFIDMSDHAERIESAEKALGIEISGLMITVPSEPDPDGEYIVTVMGEIRASNSGGNSNVASN